MYKTLWFTHGAYQELLRLASEAADGLETCGQLFGYTFRDHGYVVVTDVSGPGVDAERHPDYCNLGQQGQRDAWDRFWKGCIHELGSWHTHPCATAKPSPGDHEAARIQLEWMSKRRDIVHRFEVIVGVPPGGKPQEVKAWCYSMTDCAEPELRIADEDWKPRIDDNGNWIEHTHTGTC